MRLPNRAYPLQLEMAEPQDMSESDGGFWLPDSSSSCIRSTQHTAGCVGESGVIPSQKAAPDYILCCVSVERRWDKLYFKGLLQMPVVIGFCCGVLKFHRSAWCELQALKEAGLYQETVSARDFEKLSLCSPLTYLLHSL